MTNKPKPYERKPYKQYSREFKVEAIRLADLGDKTISEVARELGIRVNQLYKWRKQLETEKSSGVATKRGRPTDGELERLHKDNQRLKEENDILKKAAIFFARGSS
jgi:transposase